MPKGKQFMKVYLIALLSFLLSSCANNSHKAQVFKTWKLDTHKSAPESAYYHAASGKIYISNIVGAPTEKDGQGWISTVDTEGNVLKEKWIDGLNAPKGIRIFQNTLWVSDIDRVLAYDINTAKQVANIQIPGAKFLNDVATDDQGRIYVSDMLSNKIHVIENNKVSTFAEGPKLECPNGLLVVGNKLYVASWGTITDVKTFATQTPGRLYYLDLKSKKQTFVTKNPLGNLDGLELDSQGNFIVSDWPQGVVYRIDDLGVGELLFANFDGAADLGLIQEQNLILLPSMNDGTVSSLKMPKSRQLQIDEAILNDPNDEKDISVDE